MIPPVGRHAATRGKARCPPMRHPSLKGERRGAGRKLVAAKAATSKGRWRCRAQRQTHPKVEEVRCIGSKHAGAMDRMHCTQR